MNNPIFVIAYDCPHRKTFDVLSGLSALGYKNVTVFVCPMSYTKTFKPLLRHRPSVVYDIDAQTLCRNLCFQFIALKTLQELTAYMREIGEAPVLIAGAGLIPEDLLDKITFINAHPGYIPYARGLDAFKWSILENLPIGVSSHILGHVVDAGKLIKRLRIVPEPGDTFHSLAQKVYEQEIKLLLDAVLEHKHVLKEVKGIEGFPTHKRMPNDIEKTLDITLKSYHCDESLYNCWE